MEETTTTTETMPTTFDEGDAAIVDATIHAEPDASVDQTATFAAAAEASANAEHEEKHPPRHFFQMLPVELTDNEITSIAKRAAAARALVAEHESGKKAAMEEWKEAISAAENERDSLLDAVAKGTEQRKVECIEHRSFRTGVVTITRVDTGETIGERAMTWAERQPSLPGVPAAEADTGDEGDEEASEDLDAVTPEDAAEPDPGDDDGPAIEDPEAVLKGKTTADKPQKLVRRPKKAKKGGAS